MIGFLTALREERAAVRRCYELQVAGTLRGMELEQGSGAIHLCTGMGAERMGRGVESILKICTPRILVLLGYSVGLLPDLKVGSLVVDERSSPEPLARVLEGVTGIVSGKVATCGFLGTAAHKGAFAEHHPDSPVADLETEAFLEAVPPGVQSLVVRVVSDELQTNLPLDFSQLVGKDGFPDHKGIALKLMRNPFLLPKLLRLARDAELANQRLTDLLQKVDLEC